MSKSITQTCTLCGHRFKVKEIPEGDLKTLRCENCGKEKTSASSQCECGGAFCQAKKVRCPNCGTIAKAAKDEIGSQGHCGVCGQSYTLASAEAETAHTEAKVGSSTPASPGHTGPATHPKWIGHYVVKRRLEVRTAGGADASEADWHVYRRMRSNVEGISQPHRVIDGTGDSAAIIAIMIATINGEAQIGNQG